MRDVEYALMSQLVYFDWNKLHKRVKLTEFFKKDEVYSSKDSRFLMNFFNFDGWEIIYSANKRKLFKDFYNLDLDFDDGFFGAVFMRDNDIIIAYRGTEPTTLNDIYTDLELGLFKKNSSQLISSIIFYEYVRKKLDTKKKIHITGHSLGGCLAQYVYLYSQKNMITKTWNALGIGKNKDKINESFLMSDDITKYINVGSKEVSNKIKEKYIDKSGNVDDRFLTFGEITLIGEIESIISGVGLKSATTGFNEFYSKNIGNMKLSLGTQLPKEEFNNNSIGKAKNEFKLASIQIYWLLKAIKNIQSSEKISSDNIVNYYDRRDWTADLQSREGKIIEITTGEVTLKEVDDNTLKRVIKDTFVKFGFKYHGVNNFICYMDDIGNIIAGELNKKYIKFFEER